MSIKKLFSYGFVFSLLLLPLKGIAVVELVTINSIGEGVSKDTAIENALVRAVSKVNGFEIEVNTSGKNFYNQGGKRKEVVTSQDHSITQNITINSDNIPAFQADIGSASLKSKKEEPVYGTLKKTDYKTKALIKNWSLISESKSYMDGIWKVELKVVVERIKEFELSKEADRTRVAVVSFRTVNGEFSGFFEDSLNSYLSQSRRFAVIDRKFTKEQAKELSNYQSANYRKGESSRLNNMLGVDYIVVGSVSRFEEKARKGSKLKTISFPFQNKKTFVDISFRVINVATSQIKYSGYLTKDFDKGDNYSVIALSRKIAGLIGNEIINSIYPILVVEANENEVILAQGGGTLSIGDRFDLIQYGKEIIDPYTKESLGFVENKVGVIEVTNTQNKLSTASVLSLDANRLKKSGQMIARPKLNNKKVSKPLINIPKVKIRNIDEDKDW
ncbi:CsgG/HfaB family protein [Candidatus Thioglobus sp.]|nr:CsgG/HfaB family protein [Candidatus Thioglobus sp.]